MTVGKKIFIRKALGIWLLIIAAETVHGALRQITLAPLFGDFTARQISVFSGSILIFLITWLSIRWINPPNYIATFAIGLIWVLLTVSFEAGLGILAFGYTYERILEGYDLSRGGLMVIGLLFMFLSPLAAARIRIRWQRRFRRVQV